MHWIRVTAAERALVEGARIQSIKGKLWTRSYTWLRRFDLLEACARRSLRDNLLVVQRYCTESNSALILALGPSEHAQLKAHIGQKDVNLTDECKQKVFRPCTQLNVNNGFSEADRCIKNLCYGP